MIPESQHEAARFLQALSGAPPIETHISAVFVGRDTAWKLKKAVTLPFLDFAPPERRKFFARRELELNRGFAPEIYRGISGICRAADGGLHFCAAEAPEAIDWVLEMAVIPPDDFLDKAAARGRLSLDLCRQIGDLVARMNAAAPPAHPPDPTANFASLIAATATGASTTGLNAAEISAWHAAMLEKLRAAAPSLEARARANFVRRNHGDLHLGNLCLWHGVPVPFDALEFDETLATIDTGYDLAFLLMDLGQRAGRDAANAVLNRYLARTGDIGLLPLLPLFLSQRAMIRAHIGALQNKPGHESYAAAARIYLLPAPSPILAIGGLQGTGKSTLARALAPGIGPAPGALVLRSDELRKRLNNVAPETRLPPDAYSPEANARLNAAYLAQARLAVQTGHGVILDASFLDAGLREGAEAIAAEVQRPWLGLWLQAPLSVLEARLAARRNDASDAGPEVLRAAAATDPGTISWTRLDATDPDLLRENATAELARAGMPASKRGIVLD